MKLSARIPASAALLVLLVSTVGCAKLKARDQLVKGVQAFKSGQYEQATDHFQESIKLDPSYDVAKLYLATAYSYQVVPDSSEPANIAIAQKALDFFDQVLANTPDDMGALKQEASIYRNIKQYDKAKSIEIKIIGLNPKDSEANYTVGVIDWTEAYKNATTILAAAGMQDDGNGNPKKSKDVCAKLVAANSALVTEAMKYLQAAVDINPNYDDAMSYLNLNDRRKADLECGDDNARKADLAQADAWVQRAIGARKINEAEKEKRAEQGTVSQ
jgi:tetratricopeptide (TPR) repeat protein